MPEAFDCILTARKRSATCGRGPTHDLHLKSAISLACCTLQVRILRDSVSVGRASLDTTVNNSFILRMLFSDGLKTAGYCLEQGLGELKVPKFVLRTIYFKFFVLFVFMSKNALRGSRLCG